MKMKSVFRITFLWLSFLALLLSCMPAESVARQVYKISIETIEGQGMIDVGLAPYVQRVLLEAKDADAVILEINTHGGRVDSAVLIRDALLDADIRTIAFIRRAISAGALISLATDDIVMTPDATIGGATPVALGAGNQPESVSKKVLSYVRAEFRATAEATGRRSDIAEAMVDPEYEIEGLTEKKGEPLTLTTSKALEYEIADYEVSKLEDVFKHIATSVTLTARSLEKLKEATGFKLNKESWKDLKHEGLPEEILKNLKTLEDREFTEEQAFWDAIKKEIPGEQITQYKERIVRNARQFVSEDVLEELADSLQDQEFSGKNKFLNALKERIGQDQFINYHKQIWAYTQKEFGLDTVRPSQIIEAKISWAEQLVRFLTNPLVSSFLMMFGLLGLYLEFKTPGFGVGGSIGLICLGLFFWGHFLVRLAGWEELLLFLAGVILLLIELFVIPGFGIVGILGIVSIIASLTLSMVGRVDFLTWQDIQIAITKVTAALIGSIILSIVLFKFLPRTSLGQQVILNTTQKHEEGFVAQSTERSELIGMIGVTLTPLHPSGTMLLENKRYDVVSEGDFVEKNTKVVVLSVEGARIVVRQVAETHE